MGVATTATRADFTAYQFAQLYYTAVQCVRLRIQFGIFYKFMHAIIYLVTSLNSEGIKI